MTTTPFSLSLPKNPLTVCLLQPALRRDDQSIVESTLATIDLMQRAVDEHTQQACNNDNDNNNNNDDPQRRKTKIDFILLPELCPVGYSEDSFTRFLPHTKENRALLVQVDDLLQNAARTMKCAICYGTMGWKPKDEASAKKHEQANPSLEYDYTIRQVVVNPDGVRIACYDKIHLCNYGDCAETRFFTPGTKPCSFTLQTDNVVDAVDDDDDDDCWIFGLMICADMRYPQLAQTLVQNHNVNVLLQPASFARDCSFRTWKSFRETRAIESGTYFLANNYAGDYYGQTSMNPPWIDDDHEPVILGNEESYIVTTLDPRILKAARTQFPFYKHTMESKSCSSCGGGSNSTPTIFDTDE